MFPRPSTRYIQWVINDARKLERFEQADTAKRLRDTSYEDALAVFESLWQEAVELNPHFHEDWESDIQSTLAVARAVNGLPPSP